MLDSLYRYAKFQYECGNYSAASLCLYYYRNLVPQQNPNYLSALYGKLASEILLQVSTFYSIHWQDSSLEIYLNKSSLCNMFVLQNKFTGMGSRKRWFNQTSGLYWFQSFRIRTWMCTATRLVNALGTFRVFQLSEGAWRNCRNVSQSAALFECHTGSFACSDLSIKKRKMKMPIFMHW